MEHAAIYNAILSLCPQCRFSVVEDDAGNNVIHWEATNAIPQPTQVEIEAEHARINSDAFKLLNLRIAKNTEINNARLTANQTTFTHAGKLIACDPLSRGDIDVVANYIGLFAAFPPDFPGGWKAIDNSIVPLQNIDAFKSFYQSMTVQGTANFNKSQALKAVLAQAQTKAAIDAITW